MLLPAFGLGLGFAMPLLGQSAWQDRVWAAFTVPVLIVLVYDIVASLRRGEVGLDIVAVLSMAAALVVGQELAAVVVALMYAGGQFLEAFAERHARREMTALLARVPRTAIRHRAGGLEEVALDLIMPGDRLLIRQGDVIPADGMVTRGLRSSINPRSQASRSRMFMLSPDVDDRQSRMTLAAGALAVAVAVVGGILAIGLTFGLSIVLLIAAVFGLASAILYGRDIAVIFRSRKRRQLELNMRMATLSFASLAGTALLAIALVSTAAFRAHVGAFAFLAAFGWLSGLVLAKLDEIVAFLTWLETYGPVMGRAPTPRVQDLVAEGRATKWFVIYYVAVWGRTLMLLIGESGIPDDRCLHDRWGCRHRRRGDPDPAARGRCSAAAASERRRRATPSVR